MIITTLKLLDKIKRKYNVLGVREMLHFNREEDSRYYLITYSHKLNEHQVYYEGFQLVKNIYDYLARSGRYKVIV